MNEKKECIICFEEDKIFIKKNFCKCKFDICDTCLIKWNDMTKPNLKCPMCRKEYGTVNVIISINHPFFETMYWRFMFMIFFTTSIYFLMFNILSFFKILLFI